MKMPRKKESLSTELKVKLVLVVLLTLCLFVCIVWKVLERKENSEDMYGSAMSTENISGADTKNLITNLDEFAEPLLENDAALLEERMKKFAEGMGKEISSAEIFYVALPEETESMCVDFYLKLSPDGEIMKLSYDYDSNSVVAETCLYTEEEVRAEIWNEGVPTIRDMQ